MHTFLIQTINGEIQHDFSFHLLKAISYHNWLRNDVVYEKILSETPDVPNCIPVGSLEFVFSYLEKYHAISNEKISPINIPDELLLPQYLKRNVEILPKSDLFFNSPKFIKSASKYKDFVDVVSNAEHVPEGIFFVSDVVEIESEWRIFVFNGELTGVHHYLGGFEQYPDMSLIKSMINDFKHCPPAYTLDVGINENGTFLIETHPFVSCGLYGFQNYKILPAMFVSAFYHLVRENSV